MAQIGAVIDRDFPYPLIRSVAAIEDAPLQAALERLAEADILLVQGVPPDASYRFKHALIQDAAYENLLKSRRQTLHRRVGGVLLDQFSTTALATPELLAHHFTQAGLTDAAIEWWGKAGQRSLERSALVESAAQFTQALDQIATIPASPAMRREQIKFQVALMHPLIHVKGFAAPESKAAVERAHLLIQQAEALGETPEDPLLLFSVLYGFWAANYVAFNGDVLRDLATQFLTRAEKQGATGPLVIGHRLMGTSLLFTGDIAGGRAHLNSGIALYDPADHRSLATRFGQDVRVALLCYRALTLWILGYIEAALSDADQALREARKIGQAATSMYALFHVSAMHLCCENYATANALVSEFVALSDEKGAFFWKAQAMILRGCVLAQTGHSAEAVQMITAGSSAYRSTGARSWLPLWSSYLGRAYAKLGQVGHAWGCVKEALTAAETTKERVFVAEVNRIAGNIALILPEPDEAKALDYFERALSVARQQQAKSWELRTAMSMARLWRDQGKREEARELLAPVYGWFTEGFDTLDLKEAKALLGELKQ